MSDAEEGATSISEARTLEEIGEFWDTHGLADFWDETREVTFVVRGPRRKGAHVRLEERNLWPEEE